MSIEAEAINYLINPSSNIIKEVKNDKETISAINQLINELRILDLLIITYKNTRLENVFENLKRELMPYFKRLAPGKDYTKFNVKKLNYKLTKELINEIKTLISNINEVRERYVENIKPFKTIKKEIIEKILEKPNERFIKVYVKKIFSVKELKDDYESIHEIFSKLSTLKNSNKKYEELKDELFKLLSEKELSNQTKLFFEIIILLKNPDKFLSDGLIHHLSNYNKYYNTINKKVFNEFLQHLIHYCNRDDKQILQKILKDYGIKIKELDKEPPWKT